MASIPDLVLGIDCSTTSCKAIVWDRQGKPVAEGRAPLSLLLPRSSWHEQDADGWWTATALAVRAATAQVDVQRLAGLCITHQRETFVLVDEVGQPLRNAIVWMDERARTLLPELDRLCGGEHVHQITGKPLSGNLTLSKLFWLARNEPQPLERAYKILDVHAFLVHRLTGRFRTGWGCADPTGMFDMQQRKWAGNLLRAVGVRRDQMPDAFPAGAVIGEVSAWAAHACGLPVGLPVVAGLGDGQAAGLGAGVTRPGQAYLNLGTAVVSGTHSDKYVAAPAFRTLFGGGRDAYSLETVILGGTYTISWFVRQFGGAASAAGVVEEAMDQAASGIAPGAEGLLLVPYWNSAMNPYWDASASGIVVGWRGVHGKAHLYRAILEGIAFEQRLHTEGVEAALGRAVDGFVAMGGGSRSALWRQIVADVTGKPVVRTATPEAAALGAGILAAGACGVYGDVAEAAAAMVHLAPASCEPDAARHAAYTTLYEDVYRHLYPALRPYLRRLTEATESSAGPLV